MKARLADARARYRIRVEGRLEPLWTARLGDLTVAVTGESGMVPVTDLTGWIADQAALMGVFGQLYALGVAILTVERLEEDVEGSER